MSGSTALILAPTVTQDYNEVYPYHLIKSIDWSDN